jgi:hypothetical protein
MSLAASMCSASHSKRRATKSLRAWLLRAWRLTTSSATAAVCRGTPPLSEELAEASQEKYGYAPPPEAYQTSGVHVFRPSVVFAWKQFPKDVTRWRL